jgi:hypothetical protein
VATQDELGDFIRRRISVGRVQPGVDFWHAARYPVPHYGSAAVELIAAELVRDTDFRALQLGTFLNTPAGEFLEEAVALAVPRAFAPEFELIVGALKLSAKLQQDSARGNVVLAAIGMVVVGALVSEARKAA